MALGTCTVTEETHGTIKKIKFEWTSGTAAAPAQDGGCTKATTYAYSGQLISVAQLPNLSTTQPSNAYDVTVTDADGVDILGGLGADLSNAANTWKETCDGLGAVANDVLTLNVANAGSAKTGTTILYLR